jgi:hypothetical protein
MEGSPIEPHEAALRNSDLDQFGARGVDRINDVPMPAPVVTMVEATWAEIKDASGKAVLAK